MYLIQMDPDFKEACKRSTYALVGGAVIGATLEVILSRSRPSARDVVATAAAVGAVFASASYAMSYFSMRRSDPSDVLYAC